MSEPIQIIPAITILEDGGEFTVRVGEPKWAAEIGKELVSLIAAKGVARKLSIITPTDVKVFKFDTPTRAQRAEQRVNIAPTDPKVVPLRPSQRISQDQAAPPAPELVGEYEEELRQQQADEQALREQQRLTSSDPQLEVAEVEEIEEAQPAPRKRGRPSKAEEVLRNASACGRCGGQGVLDGGGSCPVCLGKGSIAKWGTGRR